MKKNNKMHVSTLIILDMFGSVVYLLSMTNRPKNKQPYKIEICV